MGKQTFFLVSAGRMDEGKEAAPTDCRDINHIVSGIGIGIDHRPSGNRHQLCGRQHCCTAAAHFATDCRGVNPLISCCQKSFTRFWKPLENQNGLYKNMTYIYVLFIYLFNAFCELFVQRMPCLSANKWVPLFSFYTPLLYLIFKILRFINNLFLNWLNAVKIFKFPFTSFVSPFASASQWVKRMRRSTGGMPRRWHSQNIRPAVEHAKSRHLDGTAHWSSICSAPSAPPHPPALQVQ